MSIYFSCLAAWALYWAAWKYSLHQKKLELSEKYKLTNLVQSAFASFVKKFLLVAAISYSVLSIIIPIVNSLSGTARADQKISRLLFSGLISLKKIHDALDENWKWVSLGVLSCFALFLIYRVNRNTMKDFINNLVSKYNSNSLEELPDTEEMEKLKTSLAASHKSLEKMNQLLYSDDNQQKALEEQKELMRLKIKKLYDGILYADFMRRLGLEIDKGHQNQQQMGRVRKIMTFFSSAGMFTTVKKTGNVLALASSSFLVLSLVTVQVAQLTPAAADSRLKLENVIVGAQIQELDEKWENTFRTGGGTDVALKPEEKESIARFSRIAERQIMNSYLRDSQSVNQYHEYQLLSTTVRHSVLNSYVTQRKTTSDPHEYFATEPFEDIQMHGALPSASGLGHVYESQASQFEPATTYGRKMQEDISTATKTASAEERTSIFKKMNEYIKSFSHPASFNDAISMAYENFCDNAIKDPVKGMLSEILGDENFFSKISSSASTTVFQKMFDNSNELKAKNLLVSLFVDKKDIDEAIASIRNTHSGTIVSEQLTAIRATMPKLSSLVEEISNAVVNAPPTITYNYVTRSQLEGMSGKLDQFAETKAGSYANTYGRLVANADYRAGKITRDELQETTDSYSKEFKSYFKPQIKETYVGGLSAYEDYFPNYLAAERATEYSKLASAAESLAPLGAESSEIFSNAFNFMRLLGNRRIGGVLIGRDAVNAIEAKPGINDINWSSSGNFIDISLLGASGKSYALGHFNKAIIAQAIAYAADGRPIATTMISCTGGEMPLKVLVHPALVNTPLGCNIINMDRFVDTYAASQKSGPVYDALELVRDENNIYNACAYYIVSKRKLSDQKDQYNIDRTNNSYQDYMSKKYGQIREKLNRGTMLNDTLFSPMRYKKSYYNQKLVDEIVQELANDGDVKNFFSDVESRLLGNLSAGDLLITESEIWSGVREQPYTLDRDMSCFALNSDVTTNPFQILSFIEQVSYKKSKFCTADIHPEADDVPWEFLYLKHNKILQDLISKNIKSGTNKEIVDHAIEFVLLQRLFRNLFTGIMGTGFPLQKISLLMSDCIREVRYVKTPEWSSSYQNLRNELNKKNPDILTMSDILGVNSDENTHACH